MELSRKEDYGTGSESRPAGLHVDTQATIARKPHSWWMETDTTKDNCICAKDSVVCANLVRAQRATRASHGRADCPGAEPRGSLLSLGRVRSLEKSV
jgi:hypothetical protein